MQAVYQNSSRASNAEFSLQSLNQATFSLLKILGICSLSTTRLRIQHGQQFLVEAPNKEGTGPQGYN